MGSLGARAGSLTILAAAGAIALWLAIAAGVAGPGAVDDLARTGAVAIAFFTLCGYGPARLLLTGRTRAQLLLYTPAVGAACATLALTVLGLLHVPFTVNLAVVLAAAVAVAALALRRAPDPGPASLLLAPIGIALLVTAIACLPALRGGFPAVEGQNPDAMMVSGTAAFLQHAPPTAVRPELGLDKPPLLWRSKLPIYYALAAVAKLAGQDPVFAFTAMSGIVVALTVLGFYLFALDGLRAPPLVALAAMLVVGLDRIVMHLPFFPLYNQLWALCWLPYTFLLGWRFLEEPGRRTAALAAVFLAVALFTYPLLLPFPFVFFAVVAWRRRHERGWWTALRLPRARSAGLRYALLVVVGIPVVLVLVRGIVEKLVPAAHALIPGGDLSGWGGMGIIPYYPFGWFFGVSSSAVLSGVLVALVFVAAGLGLRRIPRDGAVALVVLLAGALLSALYLLARSHGELFHFRDLAFAGPIVVVLAVVGAASLPVRGLAVAAVAAYVLVAADGTREAVVHTYVQTPRYLFDLRKWDREIPADQTIRIDVPRGSWQLWSYYLMPRHRVSALDPLGGPFPHPPKGVRADLALAFHPTRPPYGAVGPPIRRNEAFALYRLRPGLPGPDVSSRALIYDIQKITY